MKLFELITRFIKAVRNHFSHSKIRLTFLLQLLVPGSYSKETIKYLATHYGKSSKKGRWEAHCFDVKSKADELHRIGSYHKAIFLLRNFLKELEDTGESGQEPSDFELLNSGWGHAIGHVGVLATLVHSQRTQVSNPSKYILPVGSQVDEDRIKIMFSEQVWPIQMGRNFRSLDRPSMYLIAKSLDMMKTNIGYLDSYQLTERVYGEELDFPLASPIHFPEWYIEKCKKFLFKNGIGKDDWYVALHTRHNLNSDDVRNVDVSDFKDAISLINMLGGKVVRFGSGKSQSLEENKAVIDFTKRNDLEWLHPYVMYNCKFLLSSNSGPAVLARSMGVPVVQTDTIAIARNILSSPGHAIYLPKKWIFNGKTLSFYEVCNGNEGYSHLTIKERLRQGYVLRRNTKGEIREAVSDMLAIIENPSLKYSNETINKIRKEVNAISFGNFAPSYISKNSEWFLRI